MVSMEKCKKVTFLECDKKCTVTKNLVYSTFKTDVTTANSLELITNQKHRRALAKLRASNHNLRIESSTKLPEHLRICQYCSSNEVMNYEVENQVHFLLSCKRYNTNTKHLMDDIISKYSDFGSLNAHKKIIFLLIALMFSFVTN